MLDDGVKNGDQQRPGKRQAAPSAGAHESNHHQPTFLYRVALKTVSTHKVSQLSVLLQSFFFHLSL